MEQEQQLCESHKPDPIWVRERRQGTVTATLLWGLLTQAYVPCSATFKRLICGQTPRTQLGQYDTMPTPFFYFLYNVHVTCPLLTLNWIWAELAKSQTEFWPLCDTESMQVLYKNRNLFKFVKSSIEYKRHINVLSWHTFRTGFNF